MAFDGSLSSSDAGREGPAASHLFRDAPMR